MGISGGRIMYGCGCGYYGLILGGVYSRSETPGSRCGVLAVVYAMRDGRGGEGGDLYDYVEQLYCGVRKREREAQRED